MALIDVTDFEDLPYKIPNQEETKEFVTFIEAKEEELLKEILGIDLYNEFIEALADSGELADKWANLRDGAEYEYSVTNEYKGLVDLLKPAIYSEWIFYTYRRLTAAAMIVNNGRENTTAVNPSWEIANNWNTWVKKVGNAGYQKNNFYGFMIANEDDYENWEFTYQELKNTLDL